MSSAVSQYLLELPEADWPGVLRTWSWLLPREFTVWLVNRFADLFVVLPDGSVHLLDIGCGTFERVADTRDDFCSRIDESDNAASWLLIPLVDSLVAAGIALQPGQCYAYKQLPILGGEYQASNFAPLTATEWIAACGEIHEQLRKLPDGATVAINVVP